MKILNSLGMSRVTELTRAGKLSEATALIQSLLGAGPAPQPDPALPDDTLIEGTVIERSVAARQSAAKPAAKPAGNRRTLGQTLRALAAGGLPARPAPPEQVLPQGASFLNHSHRSAHGTRDYRLYLPANRPDAPMPLVVMLHGCTQTPEDFAAGTAMNALAEAHGLIIAYPAQPASANANRCWNWFQTADQQASSGEPALIAGIVRDILRDTTTDPAQVYVAGLSAGGAAAAILGAAFPDLFSAVGVHSGLAAGAATSMPQAFAAMRGGAAGTSLARALPTIVFHGNADQTVAPVNGRAVIAQALAGLPPLRAVHTQLQSPTGSNVEKTAYMQRDGTSLCELWEIAGAGHAWAGGSALGSYTDPNGPDASEEMLRFFRQHRKAPIN